MIQTRIRVYVTQREHCQAIWSATENLPAGSIVELNVRDVTPVDYRYTIPHPMWLERYPWYRTNLHWQVSTKHATVADRWRDLLDALEAVSVAVGAKVAA